MELLHGVDLEQIGRFEELIDKEKFLRRIYTENEIRYITDHARPAEKAAGMWAAKEAVSKAFGRGLYGMDPREIEIGHLPSGQPCVILLGKAAAQYGAYAIALSISHTDGLVVASCVAYRE